MKRMTGTLATLLLLPLLAFGASAVANSNVQAPGPAPVQLTSQDSHTCCWIYHNGIWRCVPC